MRGNYLKLVYVSRSIIPSRTANSVHVMRMCQAFADNGHEVILLAPLTIKLEEKNVTDIMKCSSISQSQISQYLWKMKLEWILTAKKDWKEVFYKIKDKKVLELISSLKKIFN